MAAIVTSVPYTLETPEDAVEETLQEASREEMVLSVQPCPGGHALAGLWRRRQRVQEERRQPSKLWNILVASATLALLL